MKVTNNVAKTFSEVLKFNPYHDRLGRFSSANGHASFTYSPGKSKAHDNAIAREKERQKASGAAAKPKKDLTPDDKDWVNERQQSTHYYTSRSYDNKDAMRVSDATKTDEKTAKNMIRAIDRFVEHECTLIRKAQMDSRKGNDCNKADKADADTIENFIQRSPKWAGGNLHRGINVSKETADDIIKKVQAGEELDMQGISSWSSESKIAVDFAFTSFKGRVGVVFHTNNKSTTKGTSIKHLSQLEHEKEVLMSDTARYKGTKIVNNTAKNLIEIYVDEV